MVLAGCSRKPVDVCEAPIDPAKNPYVATTIAMKSGGDQAYGKAQANLEYCAEAAAYEARFLPDALSEVTDAIMAECKDDLTEVVRTVDPPLPKDIFDQAWHDTHASDLKDALDTTRRFTLTKVLAYRSCAHSARLDVATK